MRAGSPLTPHPCLSTHSYPCRLPMSPRPHDPQQDPHRLLRRKSPQSARLTCIHHHRGVIEKAESVTHVFTPRPRRCFHAGFSDKLESKHDLYLEFEAEHGLGSPLGRLGAGPVEVFSSLGNNPRSTIVVIPFHVLS